MKFHFPVSARFFIGGLIVGFICVALFGCASEPIVKVDLMVQCDDGLDAALLSEPCDKSRTLLPGATFQDGLDNSRQEGSALEQCNLKVIKLQQTLQTCHTAVANHNATISALNKK